MVLDLPGKNIKPERIRNPLKKALSNLAAMMRGYGSEYLEVELRELENVFALVVIGSFIGLPSPPTTVSLRLLPYMGRELLVMASVSRRLDDMLGEMAGLFDIA